MSKLKVGERFEGMTSARQSPERGWLIRFIPWFAISLMTHIYSALLLWSLFLFFYRPPEPEPIGLTVLDAAASRALDGDAVADASDAPTPDEILPLPEPEEPEPERDWDGQLVDLPPPAEERTPEEADYLAKESRTVEEETMTRNFRVNPEVLAPEFSPEDALQLEEQLDLGFKERSSGARVGNDRFEPDEDGTMASLPSPYHLTNKLGLEAPTVGSLGGAQRLSGAPNNDLLREKEGAAVALNTKEFLYADYINQIRRMVSFYWQQNLDNVGGKLALVKPAYMTVVSVTLRADGTIDEVEVITECGAPPLDAAVVSAFRLAGPFPPPPQGLVARDGLAYLDRMGFEVRVGAATMQYQGIDPRAGVQFPGILKSPR